jgi:hypothetical protein
VAANVTLIPQGAADTAGPKRPTEKQLKNVGKSRLRLAEQKAAHREYRDTDHHHDCRLTRTWLA